MANQTSETEPETQVAANVSTPDSQASETPVEDTQREMAQSQEDSPVEANETESGSEQSERRRILIGSERDAANKQLAPTKPKAVREAEKPLELPPATISTSSDLLEPPNQADTDTKVEFLSTTQAAPTPPANQSPEVAEVPEVDLPDVTINPPAMGDLEQELQAALGEMSMDELLAQDDTGNTEDELAQDSRHKATVVKVHEDNVFFTLGGRHEGVASVRQFKKPPKPGSMMDVVVRGVNSDDGLYELAIPGASVSVADWDDLAEGAVVETRITGANTGGLECMVNTIRGFIPASQIAIHHVDNLNDYINQKLQCVVMECKPRRRKLVLSHRAVLEREQEESRKKILETIEAGQTLEGTVSSLRDFGAFVDLGGVDGLIHISKMSWDRVEHPKEVLEEGQKVRVKVEKINTQTGKIALSYRDLLEHPWDRVEEKYPVNGIVSGPVSRVANFGAFVKLEPGIEGLIHISELAHHRVIAVTNVVKEGEEVQCKILSVDRESQRIALSLKAMQNAPEPKKKEEATQDDEPPRELAVKRRKGPLKGGRDKPSGGEAFGLKW